MLGIKKARKIISANPDSFASKTLSELVFSLESEETFDLCKLYKLDADKFALAIEILQEWRLDRYYAAKAKLFDISFRNRSLIT